MRYTEPKTLWQRLLRLKGRQYGFSGKNIEEATASMREVTELLETQAMRFFSKTNTVANLCRHLEKERWGAQHHLDFEIGCCLAKLQQYSEAQKRLSRAAKLYEKDGRDWCAREIERASSLINAIGVGKAEPLLNQWTSYSIAELDLGRLLAAQQVVATDHAQARGG